MIEFKNFFEHLGTFVPDESVSSQAFIVKDYFSLRNGGTIISINATFNDWFLKGNGKIETPETEGVERMSVHVYSSKPSAKWNQETLDLLGGLDSVVVTFREMHSLLEVYRLKDANDSYLGLRGRESCFYARDVKNIPRRVVIRFTTDGKMSLSAYKLFADNVGRLNCGTRFFSYLKVT